MDKLWLGFDVDETLGRFNYLFPILDFLLLEFQPDYEAGQHAFMYLTQGLAEHETTPGKNVGLFRPGLYTFFHEMIKPLRENGTIQGMVMYSNNGNYNILRCCAMVIDRWLESDTPSFCNLIHRTHDIRKNNQGKIYMEKNWDILTKAFITGGCSAPVLGKTFFYDDSDEHQSLIRRMERKYIRVVPYYGPTEVGSLLPILRNALLQSGILKKREEANNSTLRGDDFIFDPDYIQKLYALYKHESTPKYLKNDLQKLFAETGETPEQLANVTWKAYQKVLQVLFKDQDAQLLRYKRSNTRPTAVDMKQWYNPLVTVPDETEMANAMINRMMRNRMRGQPNQTQNRSRSTSISTLRGTTAKKSPGRSLANIATNNTPMSMNNEFKAAFGLGGGRRTQRVYRRKNASRKVKH